MYIKARYLKNDIPAGKAYTFETDVPVKNRGQGFYRQCICNCRSCECAGR